MKSFQPNVSANALSFRSMIFIIMIYFEKFKKSCTFVFLKLQNSIYFLLLSVL